MMKPLSGKTALVTGGASGLGLAICERYVAAGASVIIADIDEDAGRMLATELGTAARFERLNVSLEADWADVMARIDQLDVLVNNAGITTLGSIEDVTLEQFRHEFEVDVVGVFLGCKAGVAKMKIYGGGSIINMSSMTGVRAQADLVAYNGAKAAVTHMTKSVAMHCAKQGYRIRCNSVHPGLIRTPIIDKVLEQSDDPDSVYASWLEVLPIGRLGKPEEIAAICAYLAADESAFATGAEFRIDGGSTI
jgi:NAD(P)-dependent dehydrogenase (short-subunit alcohol dehydrogenase family)